MENLGRLHAGGEYEDVPVSLIDYDCPENAASVMPVVVSPPVEGVSLDLDQLAHRDGLLPGSAPVLATEDLDDSLVAAVPEDEDGSVHGYREGGKPVPGAGEFLEEGFLEVEERSTEKRVFFNLCGLGEAGGGEQERNTEDPEHGEKEARDGDGGNAKPE
jgi:hypothetical protein